MLAQIMQRWCDVFLPQRDGHLLPNLIATGASPEAAYRHVFERDITAVNACDAIVINLDGRTVDEGAAFELGYAHALGKLCVGYRTDSRVLLQWGLNPMISVPLVHIMRTPSELDEWARSLAESRADDRPRLAVA
jgi:nucleoside 2-deoxyribosyltransferase